MGVQFAGNILVNSGSEPLPIIMGGTGQSSATAAINALLPTQAGQSGKILVTNGTNISWSSVTMTPGGSDTNVQFNDAGSFGGNANLVINKATGALTSASTFTGTGNLISGANQTIRAIKFQTAGSDRWLMQANATDESGSNAGSNFEFVRVADNGATQNQVLTVARNSSVVDFKATPTVNGVEIAGNSVAKVYVTAATTANITLSGGQTVDGVSVGLSDRVLVKNQTTATENGIWVGAVGAWTRATDCDSATDANGAMVAVRTGNTLAGSIWMQTANITTVGTQAMVFEKLASTAPAPTADADVTNKQYVDNSQRLKFYVDAASTANVSMVSGQTLDGVAVGLGNRVLVKNQTTATENGIYYVQVGAWARMADFDAANEVNGAVVVVKGGNTQAGTMWLQNAAITTVGSQAMVFQQLGGGGAAAAGSLTGTTLAANVVSSSLTSVGTLGALAVTGAATAGSVAATGTFAGSTTTGVYSGLQTGTTPRLWIVNGAASADNKAWTWTTESTGTLRLGIWGDNLASNNYVMEFTRSGFASATLTTLTSTGINLAVGTGGLQLNGVAGTAGQVLTSNGASLAPTWQASGALPSTISTTNIWTGNTSTATGSGSNISLGGNTGYPGLSMFAASSTNGKRIQILTDRDNGSLFMRFQSDDASASGAAFFTASRSANDASGITLAATTLTFTGTNVNINGIIGGTQRFSGQTPGAVAANFVALGTGGGGNYPQMMIRSQTANADNRVSTLTADRDGNGNLFWRFNNDALTTSTDWMNVDRSGNTATLVKFTSTAFNLAVGTGGLQLNGVAGTAGQVLTSNGASLAPTWQSPSGGAAGTLTGTTLAANVVSSSLTSVGTLGTLAVTGNITAADPTTATQVTTKQYVDNLLNGILWKTAVDTATTVNITLSGGQTVDGVAMGLGNRVLVKNQTTATENGVYIGAVGAWTRATDWDSPSEVNGAAVFVKNGATQADTAWVQTADITTVGTQAMTFTQFSNSGAAAAGSLTGTTLAANVVTSSLTSVGTLTSVTTSGDIQQNNATYLKGKLAAGTVTRLFGLSAANTLYIGSVDADHTGGTLFVKNGTTQMTIDANSNVGIGTSAPTNNGSTYKNLELRGTTGGGGYLYAGDSAAKVRFGYGSAAGGATLDMLVSEPMIFNTSNAEAMRITPTGGVSFGATGTAYGTAGQVLTSNGNAPPTWAAAASSSTLPRVTSITSAVVGKRAAVSTNQTVTATTWAGGGSIAVGDIFSIYNDSASAITVSAGAGLTMYKDGVATGVASVTLAARGSCTVWYNTVTEVVINGSIA